MKEVELNLIICTLFNPIDSKYYFDMEAYEKLRDTYFTFFFLILSLQNLVCILYTHGHIWISPISRPQWPHVVGDNYIGSIGWELVIYLWGDFPLPSNNRAYWRSYLFILESITGCYGLNYTAPKI